MFGCKLPRYSAGLVCVLCHTEICAEHLKGSEYVNSFSRTHLTAAFPRGLVAVSVETFADVTLARATDRVTPPATGTRLLCSVWETCTKTLAYTENNPPSIPTFTHSYNYERFFSMI